MNNRIDECEVLRDFYYFKRNPVTKVLGLRYTLQQVLYELVTVPEHIRESCLLIRKCGAGLGFRPSYYLLNYLRYVDEAAPWMNWDDKKRIASALGRFASHRSSKLFFDKVEIEKGTRILNGLRPSDNKWLLQEIFLGSDGVTEYCVQIHTVPDIDHGKF